METVNALLNLPGSAGSSERALAVSELLKQNDCIQAARYEAEDRLSYLRSETAALFTETLSAARGVTDEDALKDAADMWREDSVQAAAAFMGADIVTAANPWGCNQYGHRKGHQGGTLGGSKEGGKKESTLKDTKAKYDSLRKKAEKRINELQKVKNDDSKKTAERNKAYDEWSTIYDSVTELNNEFSLYDKYDDEDRKRKSQERMNYHIKRLEEMLK